MDYLFSRYSQSPQRQVLDALGSAEVKRREWDQDHSFGLIISQRRRPSEPARDIEGKQAMREHSTATADRC
jgi:hypothetical protein